MHVVLAGDDPALAGVIEQRLAALGIEVRRATTTSEAEELVGPSADLLLTELELRTQQADTEGSVEHGLAMIERVRAEHPGLPIHVISARGSVSALRRLLAIARQGDFLGLDQARPMIAFWEPEQLEQCIGQLVEVRDGLSSLAAIEIATGLGNESFRDDEERALRLYARRTGGTVVRAAPLTGGLSGARVMRVTIEDDGARLSNVVAKLTPTSLALEEHERMRRYVAGALPPGAYPSVVDLVLDGTDAIGGIFYQLAGGFEQSLFDLIRSDEEEAIRTLTSLRELLSPWWVGAGTQSKSVREVRQLLAADEKLIEDGVSVPADEVEGASLQVRMATQHCDLHVFNVLVNDDGTPIVIDFGKVNEAPVSFDPLTLELSLLFHPDALDLASNWPTPEQARSWDRLDLYLENCPYQGFVRACRDWLVNVAAGDREIYASLLAYATRQLRFAGPSAVTLAPVYRECALAGLAAD